MKRFPTGSAILGRALTMLTLAGMPASAGEWNGKVSFEGRLFPQNALSTDLSGSNLSLAMEPEWYQEWQDGRQFFLFVPFVRLDQNDPQRTHWDFRELTWQLNARDWELRAGIRQVFWGVSESNHLVDIINQTDLTENIDGEAKLGQPMVNFALIRSWGTIDFFTLLGFRERRFFGSDSRPGLAFPVDTEESVYESGTGRRHIDWAVRWSHALGPWDLGVSHFHGTSRDPRFLPEKRDNETVLVPVYDLIDQTGLDLQMTQGVGCGRSKSSTATDRGIGS